MVTKTLFISLVLAGCGNDVSVPDATVNVDAAGTKDKAKWSEKEVSDAKLACYGSVTGDGYSDKPSKAYCGCVIKEAETRWTYAEFGDAEFSELENDGTITKCADSSGITAESQTAGEPEDIEVKTTETKIKTVETTTSTTEKDKPKKLLRSGMTKADVLEILGQPTTIAGREWTYTEDPDQLNICANPNDFRYINVDCYVYFDSDGLVTDQEDIQTKYIDILNF